MSTLAHKYLYELECVFRDNPDDLVESSTPALITILAKNPPDVEDSKGDIDRIHNVVSIGCPKFLSRIENVLTHRDLSSSIKSKPNYGQACLYLVSKIVSMTGDDKKNYTASVKYNDLIQRIFVDSSSEESWNTRFDVTNELYACISKMPTCTWTDGEIPILSTIENIFIHWDNASSLFEERPPLIIQSSIDCLCDIFMYLAKVDESGSNRELVKYIVSNLPRLLQMICRGRGSDNLFDMCKKYTEIVSVPKIAKEDLSQIINVCSNIEVDGDVAFIYLVQNILRTKKS